MDKKDDLLKHFIEETGKNFDHVREDFRELSEKIDHLIETKFQVRMIIISISVITSALTSALALGFVEYYLK